MAKKTLSLFLAFILSAAVVMPVYAANDSTNKATEAESEAETENSEEEIGDIFISAAILPGKKDPDAKVAYVYKEKDDYTAVYDLIKETIDKRSEEDVSEDAEDPEIVTVELIQIETTSATDSRLPFELIKEDYDSIAKSIKEKGEQYSYEEFEKLPEVVDGKIKVAQIIKTKEEEEAAAKKAEEEAEAAKKAEEEQIVGPVFDTTSSMVGQRASDVFWDINSSLNRRNSFNLNIEANTPIKLEIFYTAGANYPNITMLTPNKRIYTNKSNTKEESLKIVTRHNNPIHGYSDIVYDTLYILTTDEKMSGRWEFSYTIGADINETILCNAVIDDKWEDLAVEYKTPVRFFILWWMDDYNSNYKAKDLPSIAAAEESPVANSIAPSTPEDPEPKDTTTPIIIFIIVLIIGACGAIVYLVNKLKIEKRNQKIYSIDKANVKFRRKKKKENEVLEKVLNKYDGDYKDSSTINVEKNKTFFKDMPEKDLSKQPKPKLVKQPPQVNYDYSDDPKNIPNNMQGAMPVGGMYFGMPVSPVNLVQNNSGNGQPQVQYVPFPYMMPVMQPTENAAQKPQDADSSTPVEKKEKKTPVWATAGEKDKSNGYF